MLSILTNDGQSQDKTVIKIDPKNWLPVYHQGQASIKTCEYRDGSLIAIELPAEDAIGIFNTTTGERLHSLAQPTISGTKKLKSIRFNDSTETDHKTQHSLRALYEQRTPGEMIHYVLAYWNVESEHLISTVMLLDERPFPVSEISNIVPRRHQIRGLKEFPLFGCHSYPEDGQRLFSYVYNKQYQGIYYIDDTHKSPVLTAHFTRPRYMCNMTASEGGNWVAWSYMQDAQISGTIPKLQDSITNYMLQVLNVDARPLMHACPGIKSEELHPVLRRLTFIRALCAADASLRDGQEIHLSKDGHALFTQCSPRVQRYLYSSIKKLRAKAWMRNDTDHKEK